MMQDIIIQDKSLAEIQKSAALIMPSPEYDDNLLTKEEIEKEANFFRNLLTLGRTIGKRKALNSFKALSAGKNFKTLQGIDPNLLKSLGKMQQKGFFGGLERMKSHIIGTNAYQAKKLTNLAAENGMNVNKLLDKSWEKVLSNPKAVKSGVARDINKIKVDPGQNLTEVYTYAHPDAVHQIDPSTIHNMSATGQQRAINAAQARYNQGKWGDRDFYKAFSQDANKNLSLRNYDEILQAKRMKPNEPMKAYNKATKSVEKEYSKNVGQQYKGAVKNDFQQKPKQFGKDLNANKQQFVENKVNDVAAEKFRYLDSMRAKNPVAAAKEFERMGLPAEAVNWDPNRLASEVAKIERSNLASSLGRQTQRVSQNYTKKYKVNQQQIKQEQAAAQAAFEQKLVNTGAKMPHKEHIKIDGKIYRNPEFNPDVAPVYEKAFKDNAHKPTIQDPYDPKKTIRNPEYSPQAATAYDERQRRLYLEQEGANNPHKKYIVNPTTGRSVLNKHYNEKYENAALSGTWQPPTPTAPATHSTQNAPAAQTAPAAPNINVNVNANHYQGSDGKIYKTPQEANQAGASVVAKIPAQLSPVTYVQQPAAAAAAKPKQQFYNPKAEGIMDVIDTALKGGWGGLTPDQKAMLIKYGVGAYFLKPYADRMLGVS